MRDSWAQQVEDNYFHDTRKQPGTLLDFLRDRNDELASVASKLLAIPATSTPSERVFSVAGRIVEERLTNLNPENVDALLFIHSNHRH